MPLHFILGSSGAGKTYQLYQHTIEESIQQKEKVFLVLVPEQFTLQTQKDLVMAHPNHGITNIDVLSFVRLAYRVFEEIGENNRVILEDTGKSMIIKKVLLQKKHELKLFAANVGKRGFVDEMKSMISELYQYSISNEELNDLVLKTKQRPSLNRKLEDIRTIFEGFQEFLKEKYITTEEILDVLSQVISRSKLVKNSVICLDGYTGFTPSQYKLLCTLLSVASDVYITITIDPAFYGKLLKEHQLFYLSSVVINKLTDIAKEERIEVVSEAIKANPPYRYRQSKALAFLERNLFRYNFAIFKEMQEDIQITTAKTREEEVENAVFQIQCLVREKGYRYCEIAVITGDITGYAEILEMEFNLAKIPCFIDYKRDILNNPLSELLRAVIEVIEYNYTYESIFRLLKTGLLDWTEEEIDLFELYITALGIRGRYRYLKEWKRKYRTSYEIQLEKINELRVRFYEMMEPIYQVFSKESTVKEYLTALYQFFCTYHLEEKLLAYANEQKEQGDNQSRQTAKEYEQVYRLIIETFDRIAELLGSEKLPLSEFGDILQTGLAEAKVGLIPPGTDQIVAGDIERTRLKDIKALFFLGVNDGVVPKILSDGGILSDADRCQLLEQNVELAPTKRQASYTTEFYLYLNLTKPQQKLYLSFVKLDTDGKAVKPSYLIGKIMAMFPKMKLFDLDRILKEESTKKEKESIKLLRLLNTDRGFKYLAECLREYGKKEESKEFCALYHLYRQEKIGYEKLQWLIKAAFYRRVERGISARAAIELYGATLLGSVTRMERYAACAFGHFLAYGLNLEERAEYKVALPDIGTLYHLALEKFSDKLQEHDRSWRNVTIQECDTFGEECVQEACKDFGNGILESNSRNAYLVQRVKRILKRTLQVVREQVASGLFEPDAYEYAFLYADKYLNLRGRIDRLDLYEKEDTLYVKVVDYKSGSKEFDLSSLYYGLELQLGVYLSAGIRKMEEEHPKKNIVPAGVFYYNIDDPIVEKSDHVEEDIKKKLAMNGLINEKTEVITSLDTQFLSEDGGLKPSVKSNIMPVETTKTGNLSKNSSVASEENFSDLLQYIDKIMNQFSKEIMEGKTSLEPYKKGDKTACRYCNFASICGFDLKLPGSAYRTFTRLSDEETWEKIKAENKKIRNKKEKAQINNQTEDITSDSKEEKMQISNQTKNITLGSKTGTIKIENNEENTENSSMIIQETEKRKEGK